MDRAGYLGPARPGLAEAYAAEFGRVHLSFSPQGRASGSRNSRPCHRSAVHGLGGSGRRLRVADGQAAAGVEELQVDAVDGGLARPDRRTGGNPRGSYRLAAGQRGDALVVALGRRLADAGVLDRRGIDREDHVDLGAELLGHPGGDRHPRPAAVGGACVFEV